MQGMISAADFARGARHFAALMAARGEDATAWQWRRAFSVFDRGPVHILRRPARSSGAELQDCFTKDSAGVRGCTMGWGCCACNLHSHDGWSMTQSILKLHLQNRCRRQVTWCCDGFTPCRRPSRLLNALHLALRTACVRGRQSRASRPMVQARRAAQLRQAS